MKIGTTPRPFMKIIPVALVGVGIVMGVMGLLYQTTRASRALTHTLSQIAEGQAAKTEVTTLEQTWKALTPGAQRLQEFVFSQKDLPRFLEDIEALAATAGVSIKTDVSAPASFQGAGGSGTVRPSSFPEFMFVFHVTGSFEGTLMFIEKVEQFPVLMRIKQINLQAKGSSGGEVGASISVSAPSTQ